MTNLYNCNYLPVPPRAWFRVENRCSSDTEGTTLNDGGYDPLIYQRAAQIKKGNVLQYKKNSSNLTKNQRYSQIAKGLWVNRTKSWATQTETYTNPNVSNLKRVGYVEYPINDITPGTPVNPAGPFQPVVQIVDPKCPNLTYKDGGNLICGTYQNPCTGEVKESPVQPNYHPTSDSDVPGSIQQLYWDPRIQTWYPKTRRTMNNSTDKWPINYKFLKSAIQVSTPVLSILSSTVNSVQLVWTIPNNSIPANKFKIFVNNVLYKQIDYTSTYTTILENLTKGPLDIYIVAILSTNSSPPSNVVVYNNEVVKKNSGNGITRQQQGSYGQYGATGAQGLPGRDGVTGPQGLPGRDGVTGPQGLPGRDGVNGVAGLQGKQGLQGVAGRDGVTGPQGLPGRDGVAGPQGLPGRDGVTGPQGLPGRDGVTGPQGLQGPKGENGVNSIIRLIIDDSNVNPDGTYILQESLFNSNNYQEMMILNKTGSELKILSPVTIYSIFFAPKGTNILIIPINSTVEMHYIYNSNGIQTIHASVF